jgi:hypothetical protein
VILKGVSGDGGKMKAENLKSVENREECAQMDFVRKDQTAAVRRGVMRVLWQHGIAPLAEITLPDGRRADVMGLSESGEVWIVEVKSCAEDFKADQKWRDYFEYSDLLFFAVGPEFPLALLPEEAGLILADGFGGEIQRTAPKRALAPARRANVQRLLAKDDPDFFKTAAWIES